MESAPKDRSETSSAIPFAEFFASDIFPVRIPGRGLCERGEALSFAVACGLDPHTGTHRKSMECGGAILFRAATASADSEPTAAYWD